MKNFQRSKSGKYGYEREGLRNDRWNTGIQRLTLNQAQGVRYRAAEHVPRPIYIVPYGEKPDEMEAQQER